MKFGRSHKPQEKGPTPNGDKQPGGFRGLVVMFLIFLGGLAGLFFKNRLTKPGSREKKEWSRRTDKTRREGVKAAEASYFNRLTLRLAGSGLFYALALAAGVAVLLIVYFLTIGTPPEATFPPRPEPAEMDVRTRVALLEEERLALLEAQIERLSSYGWIDREAGQVHIPIDRAMQILAQDGAP
jgi:hypothetical protein